MLRRGYATASSVKPPIALNSLTGTYATSTYLAALKKSPKELDALVKDVAALEKKLKDDAKTSQFLNNPTLSAEERSKVISSLTSGASSPILANLLEVLAQNGRLTLTNEVINDFHSLMAAHRNELTVTVTTAEPLAPSSKEMARLEKAVKGSKIAEGKNVKVVNKVNPSILGGMMVDFGDQTIDLTASSKVTKYSAVIAESL